MLALLFVGSWSDVGAAVANFCGLVCSRARSRTWESCARREGSLAQHAAGCFISDLTVSGRVSFRLYSTLIQPVPVVIRVGVCHSFAIILGNSIGFVGPQGLGVMSSNFCRCVPPMFAICYL